MSSTYTEQAIYALDQQLADLHRKMEEASYSAKQTEDEVRRTSDELQYKRQELHYAENLYNQKLTDQRAYNNTITQLNGQIMEIERQKEAKQIELQQELAREAEETKAKNSEVKELLL